jgi:hypothetical protein
MLWFLTGNAVLSAQETVAGDAFVKQAKEAGKKIIYHIDFTRLSDRFEKVWFVTELYKQDDIVVIDNDLYSHAFLVTARRKYPPEHIKALVNGLKAATERKSALILEEEKSAWLLRHDKYQKEEK